MKYILVTDTHLGIKKGNNTYIQSNIKLFDNICEYAHTNKIKHFVHAGDFFDTRKSISVNVIEISLDIIETLEDTFDSITLIIGNHDTYLKNQIKPTSLSIFKEHDKVRIIDEPYVIDNILFLPWLFDKEVLSDISAKICIGHFDINGIEMNASGFTPLHQKYSISDFSAFDMVLSGHYHVSSNNSNIKYLGSPMQFTFNEMDCTTGFYVLDTNTLELDFIEFTDYPKHHIIKDTDDISISDITNNNIKLVFTKDHGIDKNTEIIRDISIHNPNDLKIDYYNLNTGMTDDDIDIDIEIKTKLEILFDFYDKSDLPDGIKCDILYKVTRNLYNEIKGD